MLIICNYERFEKTFNRSWIYSPGSGPYSKFSPKADLIWSVVLCCCCIAALLLSLVLPFRSMVTHRELKNWGCSLFMGSFINLHLFVYILCTAQNILISFQMRCNEVWKYINPFWFGRRSTYLVTEWKQSPLMWTGQWEVLLQRFADALSSLGVKLLSCGVEWDKECFWQILKMSVFWYEG